MTGTEHPLAQWCSLCGQGYHPNISISVADEPSATGEYRWCHEQCHRDHARVVREAAAATNGFEGFFADEGDSQSQEPEEDQ